MGTLADILFPHGGNRTRNSRRIDGLIPFTDCDLCLSWNACANFFLRCIDDRSRHVTMVERRNRIDRSSDQFSPSSDRGCRRRGCIHAISIWCDPAAYIFRTFRPGLSSCLRTDFSIIVLRSAPVLSPSIGGTRN